eukprot:1180686-Prorocentrum_minimum.AAC.5
MVHHEESPGEGHLLFYCMVCRHTFAEDMHEKTLLENVVIGSPICQSSLGCLTWAAGELKMLRSEAM